jgi:hypothetical protein
MMLRRQQRHASEAAQRQPGLRVRPVDRIDRRNPRPDRRLRHLPVSEVDVEPQLQELPALIAFVVRRDEPDDRRPDRWRRERRWSALHLVRRDARVVRTQNRLAVVEPRPLQQHHVADRRVPLEAVRQHHLQLRRFRRGQPPLRYVDVLFEARRPDQVRPPGLPQCLRGVRRRHHRLLRRLVLEPHEAQVEPRAAFLDVNLGPQVSDPRLRDLRQRLPPREVARIPDRHPDDLRREHLVLRLVQAPFEPKPQPEVGHRLRIDRRCRQ